MYVCCLLFGVKCYPFGVWRSVVGVCCLLSGVRWLMFVVWCLVVGGLCFLVCGVRGFLFGAFALGVWCLVLGVWRSVFGVG